MRGIFYAQLSLALARRKATPFCAAETASLPILILTARGEPSERVKGLEALLRRSRSGPHPEVLEVRALQGR